MTAQSNSRVITTTYRIGGREYPLVVKTACKLCRHPQRAEIELASLDGLSWSRLHRILEDRSSVSREAVRLHFVNGHMPYQLYLRQQIIQEEAERAQVDLDNAAVSIVNSRAAARMTMQTGVEMLNDGRMQVDGTMFMNSIRLVMDAERDTDVGMGDLELRVHVRALAGIMKILTPEQIPLVRKMLDEDPEFHEMVEIKEAKRQGPRALGA
jgi:hypothetical protein